MSKPILFVACNIFISSLSLAAAAQQDSPGTVYINGLPCNRACQDYMVWSRQASGQRPSTPSRPIAARKTATPKVLTAKRPKPDNPADMRVAMQSKPKRADQDAKNNQPTRNDNTMELGKTGAKPEPAENTSVPTPMPDPRPDTQTAGTPPAQVTVPPAQEPQASAPKTASETQAAAASDTSSDARAAALATPNAEPVVAIFLVREEFKTLAELSNKIVAIDASQADEVTNIKIAISKAGAKDVRISEDRKFALGRVIDG